MTALLDSLSVQAAGLVVSMLLEVFARYKIPVSLIIIHLIDIIVQRARISPRGRGFRSLMGDATATPARLPPHRPSLMPHPLPTLKGKVSSI